MGIFVGETDAEQDGRQAKDLLEGGDDWNRSALAVEHGRLPKSLFDSTPCGLDEWILKLGHPRFAAVHAGDRELDRFRGDLPYVILEELCDFLWVLVRHKPHADFRHRHGRNDGLGTFAGEAAKQSVHLERRPGPDAFEG